MNWLKDFKITIARAMNRNSDLTAREVQRMCYSEIEANRQLFAQKLKTNEIALSHYKRMSEITSDNFAWDIIFSSLQVSICKDTLNVLNAA